MDETKRRLMADDGDLDHGPPHDHESDRFWNLVIVVVLVLLACVVGLIAFAMVLEDRDARTPEPRLFMRLVAVEGLGVDDDDDPLEPPVFELAVDVDTIPEETLLRGPCDVGGGDAMLRVSYRGVILAWGSVPRFTIDFKRQGRYAPGLATVLAKAEGSVVREVMRNLIRAELQALGSAEFVVDGELKGFGDHVSCKTYLFEGEPTLGLPPCLVQNQAD